MSMWRQSHTLTQSICDIAGACASSDKSRQNAVNEIFGVSEQTIHTKQTYGSYNYLKNQNMYPNDMSLIAALAVDVMKYV